jgi:hypothetical protein
LQVHGISGVGWFGAVSGSRVQHMVEKTPGNELAKKFTQAKFW